MPQNGHGFTLRSRVAEYLKGICRRDCAGPRVPVELMSVQTSGEPSRSAGFRALTPGCFKNARFVTSGREATVREGSRSYARVAQAAVRLVANSRLSVRRPVAARVRRRRKSRHAGFARFNRVASHLRLALIPDASPAGAPPKRGPRGMERDPRRRRDDLRIPTPDRAENARH